MNAFREDKEGKLCFSLVWKRCGKACPLQLLTDGILQGISYFITQPQLYRHFKLLNVVVKVVTQWAAHVANTIWNVRVCVSPVKDPYKATLWHLLRQSIDTFKSKGIAIMPIKTSREKNKSLLRSLLCRRHSINSYVIIRCAWSPVIARRCFNQCWPLPQCQEDCMYVHWWWCGPGSGPCQGWHTALKGVTGFKYLWSFVADSGKDFLTRKAQAWKACNKVHTIWQSDILRKTKLAFFRACIESTLLHGIKPGLWRNSFRVDLMTLTPGCWWGFRRYHGVNIKPKRRSVVVFLGCPPSLPNAEPDLQSTATESKAKSFLMPPVGFHAHVEEEDNWTTLAVWRGMSVGTLTTSQSDGWQGFLEKHCWLVLECVRTIHRRILWK